MLGGEALTSFESARQSTDGDCILARLEGHVRSWSGVLRWMVEGIGTLASCPIASLLAFCYGHGNLSSIASAHSGAEEEGHRLHHSAARAFTEGWQRVDCS